MHRRRLLGIRICSLALVALFVVLFSVSALVSQTLTPIVLEYFGVPR